MVDRDLLTNEITPEPEEGFLLASQIKDEPKVCFSNFTKLIGVETT